MVLRNIRNLRRPGEFPRAFMLLVWAAFAAGLLFSALGWSPVRRPAFLLRHQSSAVAIVPIAGGDAYTGSIFFVPSRGDSCWQRMLDNRTGDMWDKGYVDCDTAIPQPPAEPETRHTMSGARLLAIGKALRHDSN